MIILDDLLDIAPVAVPVYLVSLLEQLPELSLHCLTLLLPILLLLCKKSHDVKQNQSIKRYRYLQNLI
jgi:hypothetical protein